MRHGAPATRRSGRVEPFARDAAPKDGETTGAERAEPAIARCADASHNHDAGEPRQHRQCADRGRMTAPYLPISRLGVLCLPASGRRALAAGNGR
jgi:hypothetical protein